MMEKYGAEVQRYEVLEVIPFAPDDKRVVAENLTLDEAKEIAAKETNYMIRPSK